MKVKVGDTWHTADPDTPLMVQLSRDDKEAISNLGKDRDRYAYFDDGKLAPDDIEKKRAWMDEGYIPFGEHLMTTILRQLSLKKDVHLVWGKRKWLTVLPIKFQFSFRKEA